MKHAVFGVVLACCMVVGGFADARAQEAGIRTYAVMSLVGDRLSISPFFDALGRSGEVRGLGGSWPNQSSVTGSHLDTSRQIAVPVKEPVYDDAAASAIVKAIRQRDPTATVDLLPTRSASLYSQQDRLFESSNSAKDVRESLKAMLKERRASHLIVVTKHVSNVEMLAGDHIFSDAQLRLLSGSTDDKLRLEGIGFYVDDRVRVQDLKTLDRSTGVLAAFINATIRLVDAKTLEVLREQTTTRSAIIAISRPMEAGFSAWDEVTDAQRDAALQNLIRAAMEETALKLLSPTP